MHAADKNAQDIDAPMFPADAFRLADFDAELIDKARRFGRRVLAPRAAQHDRDATFPIENFRDMHPRGPARDLHSESSTAASAPIFQHLLPRRGRARPLLRRDRAVLEHACVLDAVVGRARRRLADERGRARRAQCNGAALHYRRIVEDGAIYCAAVLGGRRGGRRRRRPSAPRRGRSTAASSSTARRSSPRSSGAADYYGILCTERAEGEAREPPQHALSRRPGECEGRFAWSATGIRSACAAPSRARCCSRTCSCPRARC